MVSKSKPEPSFASTYLTKKNFNGQGLLKQVNGRTRGQNPRNYKDDSSEDGDEDTSNGDKRARSKTAESVKSGKGKIEHEPATDDEPLSSSDESDQSAIDAMLNLSNQSCGNPKDGDMDINAGTTPEKEPQATKKQGKAKGASKATPRQGTRKSSRNNAAQVTSPKRSANEMMNSASDENDELSYTPFTASQATKRRKFTVYGSNKTRNIHTSQEQNQSSSPDVLDSISPNPVDSSYHFKSPATVPPPRSIPSKDEKDGFLVPRTFHIPSPKSKKRGSGENENPTFLMPAAVSDSDTPIHSSQVTGSADPVFKQPATLPRDTVSSSSLTTSSSKNGPIFDFSLDDNDDDSPGSPLSSVGSSCSHDLSQEEKAFLVSNSKPKFRQAECPMCGTLVDADFLEEFSLGKRLNVRHQNRFCREHRKRSAELLWIEKGYPNIDWKSFHSRVQGHFPTLEKILTVDGLSKSFFRNALESSIKSGKDTRLTIEGDGMERISSGYYGSKGSRKMLDAIIKRYSSKIRRLASSDSLIKATGVSGFAQAVLVPELTVLLIKEDMSVDDEAARQVLRESMEIGDRVNSDENDVIERVEEVS